MGSEKVERFLKFDDIATSLVHDPLMGYRRAKLSKCPLPPLSHVESIEILDILKNVKKERDTRGALDQLLSTEWGKEATVNMSGGERGELERHIMKYLEGLTDKAGFKIEPEDRYSLENNQGAKIVATKRWRKGENILVGTSCPISREWEGS